MYVCVYIYVCACVYVHIYIILFLSNYFKCSRSHTSIFINVSLLFSIFLSLFDPSICLSIKVNVNNEAKLSKIRDFVVFLYQSNQIKRQIEKPRSLVGIIVV